MLYALQQRIGERDFGGESASTPEFIQLAAKVSRDPGVVPFLVRWLYGDTVPAMPGHPDWVSPPATAAAPTASASRLSARSLEIARLLKRLSTLPANERPRPRGRAARA